MDAKRLGKRIATLRRARGWTQEYLANRVGVGRQQISVWENGHQTVSGKNLLRLYDVFDVTPEQFWDASYVPGKLPLNKKAPITPVIDAGVPEVDEEGRALKCPRCQRAGYTKSATYCSTCGFPLLNLCSGRDRHVNPPPARYCETCGAKTFWGMTDDELDANGIPRFGG